MSLVRTAFDFAIGGALAVVCIYSATVGADSSPQEVQKYYPSMSFQDAARLKRSNQYKDVCFAGFGTMLFLRSAAALGKARAPG